jgi:uncharacterized protein (TIGR02391 family)
VWQVAARRFPIIQPAQLEQLSRALGDAASGTQLTRLFAEARVADTSGQSTKWKRIYENLGLAQSKEGTGSPVSRLIRTVVTPARFTTVPEEFELHRQVVSLSLSFIGFVLCEDGAIQAVPRAKTLSDAQDRADALRRRLVERNVHPDVLRYCHAELVEQSYFHAVLEATKSVAEKIRAKSGFTSDGGVLVDEAFGAGQGIPALAFNLYVSPSERSEHAGLANLIRGMFGAFRNPTAHAARITWPIGIEDALDLLTLASMLHRRLDEAHVTQSAPSFGSAYTDSGAGSALSPE